MLRRQSDAGQRLVVRALDKVSLTINHGDQVGIIGHNGAGKSTMLRVFAGIYEPSAGAISIEGRVSPLFNTSPGLDPDDTGYENIVTLHASTTPSAITSVRANAPQKLTTRLLTPGFDSTMSSATSAFV